jgi:hypothetical protein
LVAKLGQWLGEHFEAATRRRDGANLDHVRSGFERESSGTARFHLAAPSNHECHAPGHLDGFQQSEPEHVEHGIAGAGTLPGQPATPERSVLAKFGGQPEFGRPFQGGQVISDQ